MNIFDRKGLKETAARQLSCAVYSPRRLALIHTGVSLGAALLVAVISFLLEQQISTTGGLSGIGMRSLLTTAQSFLQLVLTLLAPFWEIGIVFAAILLARGKSPEPNSLTAGFRRFGPVLRLKLLQLFLCFLLALPCMYVSAGIFSMTPLSADFQALILPIWDQAMTTGEAAQLDAASMEAIMQTMFPLIPIFLVVYLAVLLPLYYRTRLAEYIMMDEEPCRALPAMLLSWQMTRGRGVALFRLDLSFWWFYALQVPVLALAYGDLLLPALGISLPIGSDVLYFLFYGLYVGAELFLFWRFGSYLHTTYALAYDALRTQTLAPAPNPQIWESEQM